MAWFALGALMAFTLTLAANITAQGRSLLPWLEGRQGPVTLRATVRVTQANSGQQALQPLQQQPSQQASQQWRIGSALPWAQLLSEEEVQRAQGYYGSGRRMRAVAAKLLAGRPIKAYTLGGSVTRGLGASAPNASYPARFFQFVNSSFPHSDHVFSNKGIGGTSSGIFAACAEQMVAPDADLVFVEFTYNDHENPYDSPVRRGFEQLLRKLLALPGQPAVVMVHYYRRVLRGWWRCGTVTHGWPGARELQHAAGLKQLELWGAAACSRERQLPVALQREGASVPPLDGGGRPGLPPALPLRSWWFTYGDGLDRGLYYYPGADQMSVFADYYDFPVVNMRAAADRVLGKDIKSPLGAPIPQASPGTEQDYFYADRMHPSDRGHKMVAEAMAGALLRALGETAAGVEPGVRQGDPTVDGLPPPMIPNNPDLPTTLCAMQEDFKPIVKMAQGFEWRPERPNATSFVEQKWGWTGLHAGDWAELEVDTRADASGSGKGAGGDASIWLTYLRSYQNMGRARVECLFGCTCKATHIDASWARRESLQQIHSFKMSLQALMVTQFPIRLHVYAKQVEDLAAHRLHAAAGGPDTLIAFFESWSAESLAGWTPDKGATQHPLALLPCYVTVVPLAFIQPNLSYTPGQATWDGTGLDFAAPPAVIKEAAAALRRRCPGTRVLAGVGGASFDESYWAKLQPHAVAALVHDLGLDGADVDLEPSCPACTLGMDGKIACATDTLYQSSVTQLRAALPRPLLLTLSAYGEGAWGEGAYASPSSGEPAGAPVCRPPPAEPSDVPEPTPLCPDDQASTLGVEVQLLRSPAAQALDIVSIMGYNAGSAFNAADSLKAFVLLYKARIPRISLQPGAGEAAARLARLVVGPPLPPAAALWELVRRGLEMDPCFPPPRPPPTPFPLISRIRLCLGPDLPPRDALAYTRWEPAARCDPRRTRAGSSLGGAPALAVAGVGRRRLVAPKLGAEGGAGPAAEGCPAEGCPARPGAVVAKEAGAAATAVLMGAESLGSAAYVLGVVEALPREENSAMALPAAPSLGVFFGASPLNLRPIELYGLEGRAAWPVANPVALPPAGPVSSPSLFATMHGALFLFYAQADCAAGGHTSIAAAQSKDGGASWRPLGVVLSEPEFSLGTPFVFQDNRTGEVYMIPDTSASGQPGVQAYRATRFPLAWEQAGTLVRGAALAGASVLATGKPRSRRSPPVWTLVGTLVDGQGLAGEAGRLAVYRSTDGPLGPYEPHPASPVALEGATSVGRVFLRNKRVYRIGRSCPPPAARGRRRARGGGVAAAGCGLPTAFQLFISEEAVEQDTVELSFGRRLWRQDAAWDSAGYSHLDVLELAPDSWVAVAAAARRPHAPPAIAAQVAGAARALQAAAWAAGAALALALAARVPAGRRALARVQSAAGQAVAGWPLPLSPRKGPVRQTIYVDATGSGSRRSAAFALQRTKCTDSNWPAAAAAAAPPPPPQGWPRRGRPLPWRTLAAGTVALLTLSGAGATRFLHALLQPFWQPALPIAVGGQFSKFTLMVMSYDQRVGALRHYIRHYSQCPSVGEVLVVWNRGPPPDPESFDARVPVRVRVEPTNSMNNRFRPDPGLHFRGVLSLDDDIMVPCVTVESAFAEWRRDPARMVGFYPRLLVPEAPPPAPSGGAGGDAAAGGAPARGQGASQGEAPPVYRWEEHSLEKREYNAVLAGAAFVDSRTAFPLYWAPAAEPARRLVDEVFNCDDLLLSFVLANATRAEARRGGAGIAPAAVRRQAAHWLHPLRRVDISRLASSVGISHSRDKFKKTADRCLAEFTTLFGGDSPLQRHRMEWRKGARAPVCGGAIGDCLYWS
eukprot:scaffold13.g276.t1